VRSGSQLLGATKGWFLGQSLNFFLYLVWWWLLFWDYYRGSQSYPGVAPTSQGGFGVKEVRLSVSVP
jgi:hypothetical protein